MLLFCGTLILGFSASAQPVNNIPVFVNGNSQALSVCQNSMATSVDTMLAINDADAGQTETWIITNAPSNGTVGGFVTSTTSTGGTIYPSGLTYTPTTGFAGADSFTVQIFDGFDTATSTIFVEVKALPTLSSTLTADTICNGSVFSYTPTSAFPGATFEWERLFTGGISNPLASGIDNPMEVLTNTTYYTLAVTYTYTITANGCSNNQNVIVNVNPMPTLSSDAADTICSGATFSYIPTAGLGGTTFTWSRAAIAGITPGASSGTGNISEMLTNTTSSTLTATYVYTLTAVGCTSTANVMVSVDPEPTISAITSSASSTLCSGTNNQLFGATIAPPAGVTYRWSAINATIVATGNSGQYTIVNFPHSGIATIKLTATVSGSGCVSTQSVSVTVSSSVAPTGKVVYFNKQFVYLDNNVDSYQWGYDDAATFASTDFKNEVFQSYPVSNPDMNNKLYWVKTSKSGCTQKTYYNTLLGVKNMQAGNNTSLTVYPNPAKSIVSVAINGANNGTTEVSLINMLGQTVQTWSGTANNMEFDVTGIPAGAYIVSCSQDNVKIATARFIKN